MTTNPEQTEFKATATVAAKRGAKNSVFCDLFSIPEYTLELYKALHPEDAAVTVADIGDTTLHNVLVDRLYNDLGFTVRGKVLIMLEAQSTWSVNILIRIFLYLAETWKEHIRTTRQYQYGSRKLSLPWPEFYVLYTGDEDTDEVYSLAEEFSDGDSRTLDLHIRVLRNGTSDRDIISQYVRFTKVFDNEVRKTGYTQDTILKVIETCRNEDILKEYLKDREKEVVDIMRDLFDPEYLIDAFGKYKSDEGHAKGVADGQSAYIVKFLENGWTVDKIAAFLGETPETIEALLPKEYIHRLQIK